MNDLILAKMREGDWGEVVRLMREERESAVSTIVAEPMPDSGHPMPFRERFETVRITPHRVADSVVEENGRFKALSIAGEQYKPSQRFLKGMAQRMKVPLSVFELFTPLEVIRRAAERAPDMQLRLTVDREEKSALALIEDKGVPIPAGNIEIIMKDDKRLQEFSNPRGVEYLHERLIAANGTKASVDEVYQAESFIRRQVRDARHQMLLCERLQEVADNPCVRYGVTDLGTIGERRRGLLPTGASVADVMNFISELNTHHGELLKNGNAANGLLGEYYARSYDLEEMYPHTHPASQYYLRGIDFGERARG